MWNITMFELPRRVVNRLNQISEQMDALGHSGQAADERYDLTSRDYLLQRFFRVETGTVRLAARRGAAYRGLDIRRRIMREEQMPAKRLAIEAWSGNAAAVLSGTWGTVSRRAQQTAAIVNLTYKAFPVA